MEIQKLIKKIDKRLEHAKEEKQHWNSIHQAVIDVLDPHFETVYGHNRWRNKGERGDRRIYDSRGVRGNIMLQHALHSLAYSPNQFFFRYTLKDKRKLTKNPRLQEWLAYVDEDINSEIQDSNFHPKISEGMQDYTTIGVLTHMLETYDLDHENYGNFIFRTFPFDQTYPIEGEDGTIQAVLREYCVPAFFLMEKNEFKQAVEANDKLKQKVEKEQDEPIEIVHYICPKNEYMQPALGIQEYVSFFYCKEDNYPLNMIGDRFKGYEEKPFGYGRWMTRSGQTWPRSPAMTVLGDAESLQALGKLRLQAAALAVLPPTWEVEGRMTDNPKLYPGGHNKMERPESLGFIEPRTRMDVAYTEGAYLANNVDDGFFVNDFQFPKDLPQMTAMEAGLRNAIKQSLFAPIIARSQYDHLKPLAIRMFWIRYRAGYYYRPPIPLRPNELDITVVSPLAKAQRQNEIILSEGYLRTAAELVQVLPEFALSIDGTRYAQWRADNTSSSFHNWLRSPDEVKAIMEQQQQQAMLQQMAPAIKDAAKGNLDLAKANGNV